MLVAVISKTLHLKDELISPGHFGDHLAYFFYESLLLLKRKHVHFWEKNRTRQTAHFGGRTS